MCVVIWQGEKANGLEKEGERAGRAQGKCLRVEVGAPRSQGHEEQCDSNKGEIFHTHILSLFSFFGRLGVILVLLILPPFLTAISASTSPPPFPFPSSPPLPSI